jgi:hypothetical protein
VIHTEFARRACLPCRSRPLCARATTEGREMTLRPREVHEAPQAAWHQQGTAEWKAEYAARAGVEGTLSQGVRGFRLRRCRYIGLAKGTSNNSFQLCLWPVCGVWARSRLQSDVVLGWPQRRACSTWESGTNRGLGCDLHDLPGLPTDRSLVLKSVPQTFDQDLRVGLDEQLRFVPVSLGAGLATKPGGMHGGPALFQRPGPIPTVV